MRVAIFERHPLPDRQPMQFSEGRRDVVKFPATCYDAGERVVYHLQLGEVSLGHADE